MTRARIAGLLDGIDRVLLGPSQVVEAPADLGQVQVAGMALAVKQDEPAGPVNVPVGGLRAGEVGQGRQPESVEQLGWVGGRGLGDRDSRHVATSGGKE